MRGLTKQQQYAKQVQPYLDWVLDLTAGLSVRPKSTFGGTEVPATRLSGALLLSTEMVDNLGAEDHFLVDREVMSLWPAWGRVLAGPASHCAARAISVKTVSARELKGRAPRPMPRMVSIAEVDIYNDGQGRGREILYGVKPDGTLVNLHPHGEVNENHARLVYRIAGLGLYLRYSWTVELRRVGSNFAVRVPTSPVGARTLLSLRDVEDGRARRAALRHWVSEHCRRRTSDDADRDVLVREHLRGATPFRWGDLEGVVRPSQYDLERLSEVGAS